MDAPLVGPWGGNDPCTTLRCYGRWEPQRQRIVVCHLANAPSTALSEVVGDCVGCFPSSPYTGAVTQSAFFLQKQAVESPSCLPGPENHESRDSAGAVLWA